MADHALAEVGTAEPERPAGEILEDLADLAHRVEHAHRSLHDVAELAPADRLDLPGGRLRQVDAAVLEVVGRVAVHHAQWRADGGSQHLDEAGLATRALAGNAVDLVAADAHRNVVDGAHLAPDAIVVHQVIRLEAVDGQDIGHRSAPHPAQPAARIDVFVERHRQEKQPDEHDDDDGHRDGDPPPGADHQRRMIVGPV
eukprot:gene2225-3005_t